MCSTANKAIKISRQTATVKVDELIALLAVFVLAVVPWRGQTASARSVASTPIVHHEKLETPSTFQLEQNDPNPFHSSTSISFTVPVPCNVILEVYGATGELVRTLVAGEMAPGRYSVRWNGDDGFNRLVGAGTYLCKMDVEDEDGNHLFTQTREMTLLPSDFQLEPNYPNPFNQGTQIRFGLPQASHVTIKVYAINGVEVRTLVDDDYPAGMHTATFRAKNLPSGTYFCVMQAGTVRKVGELILLK
jgi:flagellar hook assembly protein FlgD